ncbi:hypothetical protein GcM1_078003 [Golovinomyces cichoracearum]|uniref:Uncharacterized protein n=1 Tax=Golovinomyces cichoracearum TaxID=62708 RepID=A0A420JC70_9PEZI|nr:hypothetical protein GcM1_078003 [Golovinomyces cichoracearum]
MNIASSTKNNSLLSEQIHLLVSLLLEPLLLLKQRILLAYGPPKIFVMLLHGSNQSRCRAKDPTRL